MHPLHDLVTEEQDPRLFLVAQLGLLAFCQCHVFLATFSLYFLFILFMVVSIGACRLSVHLDWVFCPVGTFSIFLVGLLGTVHVPPNSEKHRFLGKFGSHSTIQQYVYSFQQINSIQTHPYYDFL